MKIEHIDEAVGRIVKGVNTTPDVGVGEIPKQAAKFGNKVDKDGRPPTLSRKVKGKSTNVLFNLGLTEGIKLRLERDKHIDVLHIQDTDEKHRVEVRGKKGYETNGYDPMDKLHQVLDRVGKAANISDLMNGDVVHINPHHPQGKKAISTAKDVLQTESLPRDPDAEIKRYQDQYERSFNANRTGVDFYIEDGLTLTPEIIKSWSNDWKRFPNLIQDLMDYYKKNGGRVEEARYTAAEWAIIEGGHSLDDLDKPTPTIAELVKKHGVPAKDLLNQLAQGIEAEYEHTSDFDVAKEIALDHLSEDPYYYDKLKFIESVEIDNKDGWGAVPWNQEVDYRGLRVKMKPSVFINLAASRNGEPPVPKVVQYVKDGGAIGAPFLQIFVDEDDSQIPEVRGHEGRSRMAAILEVHGDVPVEVHLFFQGKVNRNRHITPEFVEKIHRYLISENDKMVRGPLFEI